MKTKHIPTVLDPIFSDHMVLQRERPVTLFGTGDGRVTVELGGEQYTGIPAEDGTFTVTLPPMAAGGPYTLRVTIDGAVREIHDVMFGEVVLLAGQSNPELPLSSTDYPVEEYTDNPRVRAYFVAQHFGGGFDFHTPLDNRWAPLVRSEAAAWSAIAYHLGCRIEREWQVPVGVMLVVRGASVIQSFLPAEALSDLVFAPQELSVEHPVNTKVPRYAHYNQTGKIYETMFRRLGAYTVGSAVWYQGESNIGSGESRVYDTLLERLISVWRTDLHNDALPFIIVKIHERGTNHPGWQNVQAAQTRAAARIAHTYLADLTPLGVCPDIHPKNKADVSDIIFDAYDRALTKA